MHPVLEGKATLRSKFLQTLIISRHVNDFEWERQVTSEFPAKNEPRFFIENLRPLNFRCYIKPVHSCIGWVDASDYAVGDILATLVTVRTCKLTVFR
jgi:hypothetical protein